MRKKSFKQDIATGADRFFSALDTQGTGDTPDTSGVRAHSADTRDSRAIPTGADARAPKAIKALTAQAEPAGKEGPQASPVPASAAVPAYRINLKLDADHKAFLADEAWRQRISVTELLNRMIAQYRQHAEEGGA